MALILASSVPTIVAANTLDNSIASIKVDLIELPADIVGNYLIARAESGRFIAMQPGEDSSLLSVGLGTYDLDDNMVFATAELQSGDNGLDFEAVRSGGVLMLDNGKALKIDSRLVAIKLMQANGGEYLGKMTGTGDGAELIFSNHLQVGEGTLLDVTKVVLAEMVFIVAEDSAKDIVLAVEATKSGQTWVSKGHIGRLGEDGNIVDISTTGLSAFGIGIPPASTIAETKSSGAGHEKRAAAAS
jgi:hypothetical protein